MNARAPVGQSTGAVSRKGRDGQNPCSGESGEAMQARALGGLAFSEIGTKSNEGDRHAIEHRRLDDDVPSPP